MNATIPPGAIVCATRGGEGSRAVKERAIEHALAHDCALVFLFVIDAEAIEEEGPAAGGRALDSALRRELRWIGRVLLELLGAPRGTTANVFGDDAIERFAEEIASISGVEVEVARP
jgi:hypothetical protein